MKKRFWLEELRKKAGFKQYEVADLAEISRTYYSNIEGGVRKTPGDVACKIATVLDFDVKLFYMEDIKEWKERYEAKKKDLDESKEKEAEEVHA